MPSVYVGIGPVPTQSEWAAESVLDRASDDAVAARRVALSAAIARLRVIEDATRTNPGLRGVDPWAQTHRVKVCDAMADMAQILRWLVQQQVEPGDTAD